MQYEKETTEDHLGLFIRSLTHFSNSNRNKNSTNQVNYNMYT